MKKNIKGLMATYMSMAYAQCGDDAMPRDPLKGIDINKEYALIMEKKSNLSANKRAMVVARYESRKGAE